MGDASLQPLHCAVAVAAAALCGAGLVLAADPADVDRSFTNPPAPLGMAEQALGGATGPFFPSAARNTARGLLDGRLFLDAAGCGRAGCHPQAVEEWRASPHRWSGLDNPWYRKSFEAFRAASGPAGAAASRWCAGCHSPALLQSGQIDRLANDGTPPGSSPGAAAADPAVVAAGVTCTACHGAAGARSTMGQADYELDLAPLHDLATSAEPFLQEIHDHLVRTDPASHARAYGRPAVASAAFCSTCHKSHLDRPVNGDGWLREMDDYTSWQGNAISGQGARSFNFPARTLTCVECHMPAADGRRSHRFAAANSALPALHGDREQLAAVEGFLKSGAVTVDLFAISAPGEPAGVLAPLDRVAPAVRRGEARRVTVVVSTPGVGHAFPGGKDDSHDCWLELKAVDDRGRVVFWSGRAGEDSPVDPGAHFFRTRWVDEQGEPITRRDAWRARGVVYQRAVGPQASGLAHYRLEVPADAGDRITLVARLNYRKLAWDFTRWVFEGGPRPAPRPPIVVMAEDTTTLRVVDAGAPLGETPPAAAADAKRWHDYGAALAIQNDWRAARPALETVTRLAPGHPDAWVNLARVALAEGDLEAMRAALEQAARLQPDSGRVHYYRGVLAMQQGENKSAIEHLRLAVAKYPRDRQLRRDLAGQLVREEDYAGAIEHLEAALAVDPEDRAAHLALALAYRASGQMEHAQRHQKLAARFAPMEVGHILTPQFWAAHPHENVERQVVHEHGSAPLEASDPSDPPGAGPR